MQFTETHLPGVFVIDLDRHEDDRGWFARAWCREAFAAQGLSVDLAQCNLSHNARRGTLRGMHFQKNFAQGKYLSVLKGEIFDVALDLRKKSKTYGKYFSINLSKESKFRYLPTRTMFLSFKFRCTTFFLCKSFERCLNMFFIIFMISIVVTTNCRSSRVLIQSL